MSKRSIFHFEQVKSTSSHSSQANLRRAEEWSHSLLPLNDSKEQQVKVEVNRKPLLVVLLVIVVAFVVMAWQLFNLQIVNGARYSGLAEGNRLRQKVTYAQRGRILDRHGAVLADNQASFQLVVNPYLLPEEDHRRQEAYQLVASLTGLDSRQVKTLAEAKGLDHNQPLLLEDQIEYEAALRIEQKLPRLIGFSLDAVPTRQYQQNAALAHILGYVGRVNEDELANNNYLLPIDFIGKDGIDLQYDHLLRGQNGVVETEVDALGRPIRTLSEKNTQSGQDIELTLDLGLQQKLTDSIKKQMKNANVSRAAGVAINPKTGEVLASVSLPSFDNNLFNGGIGNAQYQQLLNNPDKPLYNKVTAGGYPSGSIIKPMHLAGALQEGVVNEHTTIVDRGRLIIPSQYDPTVTYIFNGWNLNGLGPMNARRAIAMSSNIYFFTVGGGFEDFQGLGVERLTHYYQQFGLGSLTGIDLPSETAGRIPTPAWKKEHIGEEWFVGDTYNISIGQGHLLVSPLQMAVATAAITNGGKVLKPHFLKTGRVEVVNQGFVDEKNLQIVREGMKQVIGGTTNPAVFAKVGVPVGAKSGTAETNPDTKRKPHAWYTAFAPYNDPEVMFVVLLEEGEGGSQFAAPAIAEAMEWYFKDGQRGL